MLKPSETVSSNFEEDIIIKNYCSQNKDDEMCMCENALENPNVLHSNGIVPYYCWFEPCKDHAHYLTKLIQIEQKNCNYLDCTVHLKDVYLDGGITNVLNKCVQNIFDESNIYDSFYTTYTHEIPNMFSNYYSFIILFLSVLLLLFFNFQ